MWNDDKWLTLQLHLFRRLFHRNEIFASEAAGILSVYRNT